MRPPPDDLFPSASERRERLIRCLLDLTNDDLSRVEGLMQPFLQCTTPVLATQQSESIDPSGAFPRCTVEPNPSQPSPPPDWPHAPVHRISAEGTYIVTAGTIQKQHFFRGAERLDSLENTLRALAAEFGWALEAWAVFSNHYHFVAHATTGCRNLELLLKTLHAESARWVNLQDGAPGRKVWFNYWDTRLTYEKSYLSRLNYVHTNAVRHRLVRVANQYRWCSAAWFERTARPAQVKTIYSFRIDRLKIVDDFEPV